ncbi:phosphate acyltransferase PlsX [Collinsella sp. AGMB00827]|uniref:Phosphate acyltransferase n=1 Tax=Collinsella ureilytica TaxID=2869515 RepID=A0ABS7MHI4_9ACTN|nr:phosphate acyltransferase PlsX [Collinsella urealyticum]MBY4796815.1 phosphate acyltransferase PlsX [Collinsella urealyticum]
MEHTQAVRVVVDVMGGDEPAEVVLAGIEAALRADPALTVLAAGPRELVEPFASRHDRALALEAPDAITMEDDPIKAITSKRKSSVVVGCRAIKRGEADAFFSAGSTGALVAAGTAYITPFKIEDEQGIRPLRPCITAALPNRAQGLTVFCDLGASPDVEPVDLLHFGQMGAAYARAVLGIASPSVGLLSNGTEEHKGSAFVQRTHELMARSLPEFAGNCEGGDLTSGSFDVVVADGFTGNVALKATEGAARLLLGELKHAMRSSAAGGVAGLLLRRSLREIKDRLSGDAYGGAILLGLKGVLMIGHGATSPEAVKNGTLACARTVRAHLVENVAGAVSGIVR